VLEHEHLVETEKVDGRRRYYPVGTDHPALRAALRDPTRAALLRALDDEGEAPNGRLADALDRDPSTVTYHLQRLEDDGVVVRERDGRSVRNRLATDVADALPSPPAEGVDRPAPADD
jgi:DNA-binding transcriptional ArsR family regulator